MLDEEGALPHLPERPPAPEVREQLCLGVAEAKQLARLRKLVGGLRVDDFRLGVGEESLGEPELAASLGASGAEVGEPVQDDYVLGAEGPGELERLLQPLADSEAGEDPPALVDDDDPLCTPLICLRLDHRLQPGGRAGHQDPERCRVRIQDRAQVEDDEWRVKVEPTRSRAVEHAVQVPGAKLVERERHGPYRVRDLYDVHRERIRHLGARMDEDVDYIGKGGLPVRAPRQHSDRFLAGTLLLWRQRTLQCRCGD